MLFTGWALKALPGGCDKCASAVSRGPDSTLREMSTLTTMKEYRVEALRHPSAVTFALLLKVEKVFRRWRAAISEVLHPRDFLLGKIAGATESPYPSHDHDTSRIIIRKYLDLRIHISCAFDRQQAAAARLSSQSVQRGSRSMAGRQLASNLI